MTMAAATTTMRSIRAPSKALILALVICIRSCISFQISYSSRKTTASRQWQKKSSHQTSTPTTQSIAAIHHHYRLPPPRILRSTKSVDDKDCDCSDRNSIGNSGHNDNNNNAEPLLLQPYLPAMDSNYPTRGPIGLDKFVISRSGPPTIEELSNEQMLRIVQLECSDLEVNTLVWKCLGYRFDTETQSWLNTECFPKWKDQFPTPPDLIGMKRVYSREVDSPSLRSNQALVRSIPVDNKQSLKAHLKPLGWKGYQVCSMILEQILCSADTPMNSYSHKL